MEKASGVDVIQALLTAAANPKLTPGPWIAWRSERQSATGNPTYGGISGIEALVGLDHAVALNADFAEFAAAARNGLRAFAEEWLRYGQHVHSCIYKQIVTSKCTCGWSARRQQIEVFLSSTLQE